VELRSRYAMTVCSGKELKVKKHLMMLKQRHERKNISVGVENFLYRKRGFYWRRNSFVIMILLAKVSHIEKMMVQVQCGQDSRLPPVRIFNKERVITYRWEKIIKIQYAVIYVKAAFKAEIDKSV